MTGGPVGAASSSMAGGADAGRAGSAPVGGVVLIGALVLAGLGVPLPAAAQEAAPREAVHDRPGWIGVGIQAGGRCAAEEPVPCGPAVVGSVIMGGPADRAGIQPGDTLLAVSERRIRRGPDDPVFRTIRAGDPVTVRVARGGERIRLQVTPRTPPDSLAVVRLRAPPPPGAPAEGFPAPSPLPGYALALPEAARSAEPRVVRLVPVGQAGELSRILVHARVEALRSVMEEARARTFRGQQQELARQQQELRAARRIAREMELRAARVAAEQWRSWVDDSLKVRLDAVHDSVLALARDQLAAMIEARSGGRGDARVRLRMAPSTSRDRIAGAEFEGLTPELSEFFGGLEDGVLVLRVLPETPAAALGLRPGDVIVEAAGELVSDVEDLRRALQASNGTSVEVKWSRKGEVLTGQLRR